MYVTSSKFCLVSVLNLCRIRYIIRLLLEDPLWFQMNLSNYCRSDFLSCVVKVSNKGKHIEWVVRSIMLMT